MLWTEKYRPKDISTFESHHFIKNILNQKNDIPNLLLYGRPGTGKTTFAHLVSTKHKLELNASDERGINIIREKIKLYTSSYTNDKTVILDECENLTHDAQHCLRRIIEDSVNTRFVFTTNYLSKVILPLQSRLVKLKFNGGSNILELVGLKEGFNQDKFLYDYIYKECGYDLRKSINVLQGVEIKKSSTKEDLINLVNDVIGIIPNEVLDSFYNLTLSTYKKFIRDFIREGYSLNQFVYQLVQKERSPEFILCLSEIEEKILNGCTDEICLTKIVLSKILN